MTKEDLFKFYEKLYFYELDRREKLGARLNIPLAVLAAVIGFLSFMLKNRTEALAEWFEVAFWVLYMSATIATMMAAWFFRKSWFGHTDKLLPTANETEAYRQKCAELYVEFENCDQLVEEALQRYLYEYYMRFSTENTINNDARAFHLYRTTASITAAVLLAFAAYVPFLVCNYFTLD